MTRDGGAVECRDSLGSRENSKEGAGLTAFSAEEQRFHQGGSGVATHLFLRVRNPNLPLHRFLLQHGIPLRSASNTAATAYRGPGRPPGAARVDANYP